MTLEDMLNLAEQQAQRVLLGTKEELMPSWLLVTGKGAVEIYATPWSNTREKHLVTLCMKDIMREKHCTAYSLLVEAWMATVAGEEAKEPYDGPPPSERPDRQECVVIMAVDHAGKHVHKHLMIKRDAEGRCAELRRLDGPEDKITSMIFDNLLHRGRPH